jgi:hypothetical protein
MGLKDFFNRLGGEAQPGDHTGGGTPRHLDLPTTDIEVAGESYHLQELAQIFSAAGRPLGGVIMRNAVLVAEPTNRYDPSAVAIYIDGLHVGYVPRELAPQIQPSANAYARSGQPLTVLSRVWACCEAGNWSARVTLSLSGQSEAEWSYVDRAAWRGDRSPDGLQRLTRTAAMMRIREAEAAGMIRGQDFESLRPDIAQAKSDGDLSTALRLLSACVDAAERRAKVYFGRPTPWPTEQTAILLRSQKDYSDEVAVLERFLAVDPTGQGTKALRDRLAKAQVLAGQPSEGFTPPGRVDDAARPSAPQHLGLPPGASVVVATLSAAAEVAYEKDFQGAIRAIFDASEIAMGSAVETQAILRELPQPHTSFNPVAVYVSGRLIGYVGAPYADAVRELLRQPHLAGSDVAIRCRIYATDTPKWTARATLGPYETAVAAVDDSQSAAEGRSVQSVMAGLREERLAGGDNEAAEQRERLVRGRDFVEWVEPIKQLRRDGHTDEAVVLLMECVNAAERNAKRNGWLPPTWYTEQAAIILRKQGDLAGEVALLERFMAACPVGRPQVDIAERLVKARAKLNRASG